MFTPSLAQVPVPAITFDDVLAPYVYVFYAAFLVSFLFTPIMRSIAVYYDIIDEPDGLRKLHKAPVAYLGGAAVFLGWITGLALSQFLHLHRLEVGWPDHVVVKFSIVGGACIIVLLGLWDDLLSLKPWVKIAGQCFAALFLLWDGIGTHCTEGFLEPVGKRLAILGTSLGWSVPAAPAFWEGVIVLSSSLLVICLVVGCCNATNLLDGLDGLCGGVTAIIAAAFLFIAVNLAVFGVALNTNWDGLRIVLGLALLGGVLGFIPYNFNPASIFMGDTGSMFLGFSCAVMIILLGQQQHPKWFLAGMVIFALPILDTSLAFARRYVNRRPLFSADKFHIHHQLVARGFSIKQTVIISYGLAIGFALLGIAIVFMRTRYAVAFYLVIFGSIIVAAYKMGMVHERPATLAGLPQGVTPEGASQPFAPADALEIPEQNLPVTTTVATPTGR